MSEIKTIHYLLQSIVHINNKYEAVGHATGENFNIFRLLQIESREVKTHSVFLSELLNPKGCHQKGSIFLNLFIKQLNLQEHIDGESCKVSPEFYVGTKTKIDGGRIDIVVSDNSKNQIFIENKIYAGDQENQLLRYHNYDKKAKLFYLTLEGKDPKEISKGGELSKDQYSCISYEKTILDWLENCRKESVNQPILRETITQYIYLIKYLTNQTQNKDMQQEIVKIVTKDSDTLKAYFDLLNSEKAIYIDILGKLEYDLIDLVENNWEGLTMPENSYSLVSDSYNYPGFYFVSERLNDINLTILFQFNEKIDKDFYFGFSYNNKELKSSLPDLNNKFIEAFRGYGRYNETGNGIFIDVNNEYKRWNRNTYQKIFEGDFIKYVNGVICRMMEIIS